MRPREEYLEYRPGMPLQDFFEKNRIPMLTMRHLRQLDFPITRQVSYERTVDEFLLQLAVNDMLRPLRIHPDLVILLDQQGALVRKDTHWTLLFTPNKGELETLADDAELYPVLQDLLRKEKEGKVCRVRVPARGMKTMVQNLAPFCILDEYCKTQPGRYLAVAEDIVMHGPEKLFEKVPVCHYGKLSTVDKEEIENYHTINSLLDDYIYQYDHREGGRYPSPLSVAIFGAPGSGKSFGVRQIAKSSGRFSMVSLNLSQYSTPDKMFKSLHDALQKKQENAIPLIFFDEFDAEYSGTARGWLKYFLAPMQDGEYTIGGRVFQIHGAVFVFAGATASSFSEFLPKTPEEEESFRAIKGPDFVSRLKGILNIKGPNPLAPTDRSHIIRRAMLLREQIVNRVSRIYDEKTGEVNISQAMLSALLTVSEYRHGARSLNFILDMSRLSDVDRFTPSCLPIAEQLDIHLDVEDFQRKLAFEQILGSQVETYAEIAHMQYVEDRIAEAERTGATPEQVKELRNEPDMLEWDKLDEFYREGYRSQIRYTGEQLQRYDGVLGLRPIHEGTSDAITDLYGPALEILARVEHERWMQDKLSDGWRYGEKKDKALKITPELVPFKDLDESTKEYIRASVRNIPGNLRKIGYELYRKNS